MISSPKRILLSHSILSSNILCFKSVLMLLTLIVLRYLFLSAVRLYMCKVARWYYCTSSLTNKLIV